MPRAIIARGTLRSRRKCRRMSRRHRVRSAIQTGVSVHVTRGRTPRGAPPRRASGERSYARARGSPPEIDAPVGACAPILRRVERCETLPRQPASDSIAAAGDSLPGISTRGLFPDRNSWRKSASRVGTRVAIRILSNARNARSILAGQGGVSGLAIDAGTMPSRNRAERRGCAARKPAPPVPTTS